MKYTNTALRIKRGDIFWIEGGKSRGSVQDENRPAIIVSNDDNNEHSATLEVVFLTTAEKTQLPTHCTIRSAPRTSTAICEQITTISADQLGTYAGHCSSGEIMALDACIAISLGLPYIGYEEEDTAAQIEQTEQPDVNEEMQDTIEQLERENMNLKIHLAASQKGEAIMKELYMSMVEKYMSR